MRNWKSFSDAMGTLPTTEYLNAKLNPLLITIPSEESLKRLHTKFRSFLHSSIHKHVCVGAYRQVISFFAAKKKSYKFVCGKTLIHFVISYLVARPQHEPNNTRMRLARETTSEMLSRVRYETQRHF